MITWHIQTGERMVVWKGKNEIKYFILEQHFLADLNKIGFKVKMNFMKFTQTLKSVFPSSVTKNPGRMSILRVVNSLLWSRESKVVLEMCSCYQKVRQLSKMSYRGKNVSRGCNN